MARSKHCPKCDDDISDTYEGADPDTGIMSAGWYCEKCDLPITDDSDGSDDYLDGWKD